MIYLEANLKTLNQALQSNNENLGPILSELGDMSQRALVAENKLKELEVKAEQLEQKMANLERQIKNNFWFSTAGITLFSVAPVILGTIEYCNGNEQRGKDYMWTGLGMFLGGQLIYQGGHWIFQIW